MQPPAPLRGRGVPHLTTHGPRLLLHQTQQCPSCEGIQVCVWIRVQICDTFHTLDALSWLPSAAMQFLNPVPSLCASKN